MGNPVHQGQLWPRTILFPFPSSSLVFHNQVRSLWDARPFLSTKPQILWVLPRHAPPSTPSPLLPGDLLSRDLLPRSCFQVLCGPQRIPSPLSYPSEPGLMQLPATSRLTPQHKPLRTRKKFQAAPPLLLAWLPTGLLFFFFFLGQRRGCHLNLGKNQGER